MRKIFLLIACCVSILLSAQEKSINDYYNSDFDPFQPGNWFLNISMGLNRQKAENQEQLLQNIQSEFNRKTDLKFGGGYFIKPDIAAGAYINYVYKKSEVNFVNNSGDTVNAKSAGDKFIFAPFLRNIIPLSQNQRFNLYNDTSLTFGFGNTNQRTTRNPDDITKTYEKEFTTSLGISPGINFFVVRNFAFEAGVDLLGFQYNKVKTTYDGSRTGTEDNFKFNFKIQLLSLDFGLAYYF